jgi:iron complex outermembrane receptor protein
MRKHWKGLDSGRVVKGRVGLLLTMAMVLGGAPAFAQTAAGSAPAAPASPQAKPSPAPGVEEIVVTAQKREQLSQQVPIALTAITADNIRFRGIDELSDLAMQVPGMQYAEDQVGGQQIFIRGIGVDDTSNDIESPIATYVDGVYQTRTFRAPTLGIDLERIEVLKGPQGTLFGRNATGGAVNIILTPPSDDLTGVVKVGGGSYGQVLTQAAVSGPLIKHVLDIRISGAFSRDDGWIINENTGRPVNNHNEGDGRIALTYHPLDNLQIDYDFLASKATGGGSTGTPTNIQLLPPKQQLLQLGFSIPASTYINGNNPWKGKFFWPFYGNAETTQNSGTAKWDIASWASLKSITAFQQHTIGQETFEQDGTGFPLADFGGLPSTGGGAHNANDRFFSEELNLTGSKDINLFKTEQPITWILGGYYGYENYSSSYPAYHVYDFSVTGGNIGRETLNTYSLFADGTIPLPWNFSAFGGVRYTYDKKTQDQSVYLRLGKTGPYLHIPGLGGTCTDLDSTDQFHNVSPRVGVAWAPTEAVNFYTKFSSGYNAGGHYAYGCQDGYKPETLNTVEGGVKGRFFDGRLTIDFAGYWNVFKNFQIYQNNPPVSSILVNAPAAEEWGGEFGIHAIPPYVDNARIDLGFTIMHSQYDKFNDEDPFNPSAGFQNLAGNQVERAPNHTEFVGLEYDWEIAWDRILGNNSGLPPLGALRLRGEWYHTDYLVYRPFGKTGFAGANDVQNPYSIFNFFATLPTEDGKWSLRFFAKNFTNTKYFFYKGENPWGWDGTGGLPPWFGGDLTYRF